MSLLGRIQASQRHALLFAGCVFALYSIVIVTTVQLIVLPYILPGMHAGHGLLAGGDFPALNDLAVQMADRIANNGWRAWELLPTGQSGAGIAAAIYALSISEPWALIPFNAVVHALGGVIVVRIVQILAGNTTIAFFAGALYVAFPSSLQWVSQIQKDSTYFAGMLAVLLGLITLVRAASRNTRHSEILIATILTLAGLLFVSVARLYGLDLLKGVACMIAIIIAPSLFKRWLRNDISNSRLIMVIAVMILVIFAGKIIPHETRIDPELPRMYITKTAFAQPAPRVWHQSEFLPDFIDRVFRQISIARFGWTGETYASAGSMIDAEVQFESAREVINYLPRALHVGFLAPFPEHWIAPGSSPGSTAMRQVAGIEMTILYPILLIGLPLGVWRWKGRVEFWMIVVFLTPIIVAYTCVIPNLGTLYRIRYGFLMTLAAVGFAAIWLSMRDWHDHRKPPSII